MMRALYYLMTLFCALLTVIVTAYTIQAAITGHVIAYVLLPIIAIGAVLLYGDAISIIDEEDKLQ